MPPKEDKTKVPASRSKSAENKWAHAAKLTKGITAVSRSLPTLNRNVQKKPAPAASDGKVVIEVEGKKKRKKKKKSDEGVVKYRENRKKTQHMSFNHGVDKEDDVVQLIPQEPPKPKIIVNTEDKRKKTLWRHIMWLVVLFAYSLLGGLMFSAIEGGYDRTVLLKKYEKERELIRRRDEFQNLLFKRFRDIDRTRYVTRTGLSIDAYKFKLARDALRWYETQFGLHFVEPEMKDTKWDLWGGIYYAASLYTTIGYGNFHPKTTTGRIVSMMYAIFGIPLVFTILLEWGFLYFTWIEYTWNWLSEKLCQKSLQRRMDRKYQRERIRRVGSELSLRSMSTAPLLGIHSTTSQLVNNIDHQIESNHPLKEQELVLAESEQSQTLPMRAALIFFVMWCSIAAFIVRLWETDWTYFSAFYFFFTSLTTIGLGDVVSKSPNFVLFNLALTLVGLSVVGLCLAIVQAKVRLVFDRLIRSIDSQYRIRQIDHDIATMSLLQDENEGVKRLMEAQPLQDRVVFLFMDEHKKCMLKDRWRIKSGMTNRVTQTYPIRSDKYVQTGHRVYHQSGSESDEDEEDSEDISSGAEFDEQGVRIVPSRRYIYTVFD